MTHWKRNGVSPKTASFLFISEKCGVSGEGMLSTTCTCLSSSTTDLVRDFSSIILRAALMETGCYSNILCWFACWGSYVADISSSFWSVHSVLVVNVLLTYCRHKRNTHHRAKSTSGDLLHTAAATSTFLFIGLGASARLLRHMFEAYRHSFLGNNLNNHLERLNMS